MDRSGRVVHGVPLVPAPMPKRTHNWRYEKVLRGRIDDTPIVYYYDDLVDEQGERVRFHSGFSGWGIEYFTPEFNFYFQSAPFGREITTNRTPLGPTADLSLKNAHDFKQLPLSVQTQIAPRAIEAVISAMLSFELVPSAAPPWIEDVLLFESSAKTLHLIEQTPRATGEMP